MGARLLSDLTKHAGGPDARPCGCQGAHMGMRAQQGALDGVLRGKQQPHDFLPTLKSEIIDSGLLPNKRTHALLAEYSLQPGKVKEARRRLLAHALGRCLRAATQAHTPMCRWRSIAVSCQTRPERAMGLGYKAWDSPILGLHEAVALTKRMTCKACTQATSCATFVMAFWEGRCALHQPTCFAYICSL